MSCTSAVIWPPRRVESMALPEPPEGVKLLVGVLWAAAGARDAALRRVQEAWGPIDFAGADHRFDVTSYYEPEMGAQLWRRLVAFERLVNPDVLAAAKLFSNEVEAALASQGQRAVNLDVGYLDHGKLVLASAKAAAQKIYVGDGIYADLIGRYKEGRYQPFEWTFPDFRDGRYDADLAAIRAAYLEQRRAASGEP